MKISRWLLLLGIFSILFTTCKMIFPLRQENLTTTVDPIKEELIEEVLSITADLFPEEDNLYLESILIDASEDQLSRLVTTLDEYDLALEQYFIQNKDKYLITKSRDIEISEKQSFREQVGSLVENIFSDDHAEYKKAFITSGMGVSAELFGALGAEAGFALGPGGLSASISEGYGSGIAFDFMNFKKYTYEVFHTAIGIDYSFGAGGGIGTSAGVVYANNFNFGNQYGQSYEKSLSVGGGFSVGADLQVVDGLGLGLDTAFLVEIDNPIIDDEFTDLPQGPLSGPKSYSVLIGMNGQFGLEAEAAVNIGLNGYLVIIDPDQSSIQSYLDEEENKEIEYYIAGLKMATDIITITPSYQGAFFAVLSYLNGLWYNDEYFSDYHIIADVSDLLVIGGNKQIELSWTEPTEATFDHIEIWYGIEDYGTKYNGTINPASTIISGLENDTQYNVIIKVFDSNGNPSKGITNKVTPNESYIPDTTPPMIPIVGGYFTMGDTWEDGDSDELPVHSVTLSDFSIAETEVTWRQWVEIYNWAIENDYLFYTSGEAGDSGIDDDTEDEPVTTITWYDCVLWCNAASEYYDLQPLYTVNGSIYRYCWDSHLYEIEADWTANGFRLPTEAEWEYAAKGGQSDTNDGKYAGSSLIDDVAWYYSNYNDDTHPVGTKQANELGLYDMSGNVSEWCWDLYGDYSDESVLNPTGPVTGTEGVIRGGGGYYGTSHYCRVSNREDKNKGSANVFVGFRPVIRD